MHSLRECARQRHHRHRTRTIVVRAVPDSIVGGPWCHAPGRRRTFTVGRQFAVRIADVVVVRTDHDERRFQLRIAAFDDPDHVLSELSPHDLVVGVDMEGQRDALKTK